MVSIVGPSGAGKSTLLHLIGTLDLPSEGSVLIDGRDVTKMSQSAVAALRNRMRDEAVVPVEAWDSTLKTRLAKTLQLHDPAQHATYNAIYGLDPGMIARAMSSRPISAPLTIIAMPAGWTPKTMLASMPYFSKYPPSLAM